MGNLIDGKRPPSPKYILEATSPRNTPDLVMSPVDSFDGYYDQHLFNMKPVRNKGMGSHLV